ncbi:MAG: hypothetical protein ACPGRX_00100, partial [Bdellovibrionales bacterium]
TIGKQPANDLKKDEQPPPDAGAAFEGSAAGAEPKSGRPAQFDDAAKGKVGAPAPDQQPVTDGGGLVQQPQPQKPAAQ